MYSRGRKTKKEKDAGELRKSETQMVKLDLQKSAAKKLVNKVYLCILTYLIFAGLCNIQSLYFTKF